MFHNSVSSPAHLFLPLVVCKQEKFAAKGSEIADLQLSHVSCPNKVWKLNFAYNSLQTFQPSNFLQPLTHTHAHSHTCTHIPHVHTHPTRAHTPHTCTHTPPHTHSTLRSAANWTHFAYTWKSLLAGTRMTFGKTLTSGATFSKCAPELVSTH